MHGDDGVKARRSLQDAVADLLRTAKLRSFLDLEDHLDRTNQRRARQIVDQVRRAAARYT